MTITLGGNAEKTLSDLSQMQGIAPEHLIENLLETYRCADFIRRANETVAALRSDAAAWAEELEERKAWDLTLADGLDEDEWDERLVLSV